MTWSDQPAIISTQGRDLLLLAEEKGVLEPGSENYIVMTSLGVPWRAIANVSSHTDHGVPRLHVDMRDTRR